MEIQEAAHPMDVNRLIVRPLLKAIAREIEEKLKERFGDRAPTLSIEDWNEALDAVDEVTAESVAYDIGLISHRFAEPAVKDAYARHRVRDSESGR
jgi:hypothetical protein